jgi:hypothetical protein
MAGDGGEARIRFRLLMRDGRGTILLNHPV